MAIKLGDSIVFINDDLSKLKRESRKAGSWKKAWIGKDCGKLLADAIVSGIQLGPKRGNRS